MMNRIDQITSMLKDRPKDEFLNYALAQEFHKSGQYSKAEAQYKKVQKINAEYVGLYYHLADCLTQQEKQKEAILIYDEGIIVAKRINDLHALSELQNAKMNLEMEML